MSADSLIKALKTKVPEGLAKGLVQEFQQMRLDVATSTLVRASPGKFVETLVQILQHLEGAHVDKKPDVDGYLTKLESRAAALDDGLRICAARVARAMYTLRNKRAIAHIGTVDPNVFDLRLLFTQAQWVLAELLRVVLAGTMADAGRLVAEVLAPVDSLVEDINGRMLVHGSLTAREEVLLVLRTSYPDPSSRASVLKALDRRSPDTARKAIAALWKEKAIEGDANGGYRLSRSGVRLAEFAAATLLAKGGGASKA